MLPVMMVGFWMLFVPVRVMHLHCGTLLWERGHVIGNVFAVYRTARCALCTKCNCLWRYVFSTHAGFLRLRRVNFIFAFIVFCVIHMLLTDVVRK